MARAKAIADSVHPCLGLRWQHHTLSTDCPEDRNVHSQCIAAAEGAAVAVVVAAVVEVAVEVEATVMEVDAAPAAVVGVEAEAEAAAAEVEAAVAVGGVEQSAAARRHDERRKGRPLGREGMRST